MQTRQVTHLQLTKALFVPNLGEIRRTISGNPQGYPGIKMYYDLHGVNVSLRDKSFLIPWSMIECAVLEEAVLDEALLKKELVKEVQIVKKTSK